MSPLFGCSAKAEFDLLERVTCFFDERGERSGEVGRQRMIGDEIQCGSAEGGDA